MLAKRIVPCPGYKGWKDRKMHQLRELSRRWRPRGVGCPVQP